MAILAAYPKQYAIGPAPIRPRPDWCVIEISERLFLSHCPKLRVTHLRSRDHRDYWLLGLAVPTDHPVTSIADAFALKDSAEVEAWTGFWAGKWLLVAANGCWQDASGLLALHYRRVEDEIWLSSSTKLLGERLPNSSVADRIPWHIAHEKGIDWIPAPYTTRRGIHKLLPQRTIDLRTGAIRVVEFSPSGCDPGGAPTVLAGALKTALGNWAQYGFKEHWLSMTAGLDTRTILAAASAAGIEARTYTTNYSFIDARDRIWAPRLAAQAGLAHRLRQPMPLDAIEAARRVAAFTEHTDGASAHPSFEYMAHHHDDMFDDGGLSATSGNAFEVGRCFYWRRFAVANLAEAPPDADRLLAAFTFRSSWQPRPLDMWRAALQSWIDTLADRVPVAHDWRDRFYLDQRLGSWGSAVQRSGDLFESTVFTPGNCLWIFHVLLQASPQQRLQGAMQREAIRFLAPRLMSIPINPDPLPDRIKQAVKSAARTLLRPRGVRVLKSWARLASRHRAGASGHAQGGHGRPDSKADPGEQ